MASSLATASAHSEKHASGTTYPVSSEIAGSSFSIVVVCFLNRAIVLGDDRRSMPTTSGARKRARETAAPASAAAAAAASARSHLPPVAPPFRSARRVSAAAPRAGRHSLDLGHADASRRAPRFHS